MDCTEIVEMMFVVIMSIAGIIVIKVMYVVWKCVDMHIKHVIRTLTVCIISAVLCLLFWVLLVY